MLAADRAHLASYTSVVPSGRHTQRRGLGGGVPAAEVASPLGGENMRCTSILGLMLLLGCAGPSPPATAPASSERDEAVQPTAMPTREDFFREVLEPRPLPTSASFHDYAPDSYYIDKIDFWKEFPSFAQGEGHQLQGLAIFGPTGPLWAYYVFVFLEEGDQVRVNQVVFPHARLTAKQTAVLSRAEAERWLGLLSSIPGVTEIPPDPNSLAGRLPANDLGDFRFDLLVVYPIDPTRVFISGVLAEGSQGERPELYAHLNALIQRLEPTYEHGDAVPK